MDPELSAGADARSAELSPGALVSARDNSAVGCDSATAPETGEISMSPVILTFAGLIDGGVGVPLGVERLASVVVDTCVVGLTTAEEGSTRSEGSGGDGKAPTNATIASHASVPSSEQMNR